MKEKYGFGKYNGKGVLMGYFKKQNSHFWKIENYIKIPSHGEIRCWFTGLKIILISFRTYGFYKNIAQFARHTVSR